MTVKVPISALPNCVICSEQDGKQVAASYLAYITRSVGSVTWKTWELVCSKHKRRWAAYSLQRETDFKVV